MKKYVPMLVCLILSIVLCGSIIMISSCANGGVSSEMKVKIDSMQVVLKAMSSGADTLNKNLQTFDTLDYTVFSNQEWIRLHESHSHDIKVNWPDGHFTIGIDKHIECNSRRCSFMRLTPGLSSIPSASETPPGNRTCVTGVFEGTFTKPMPIGKGKFIQPTGKAFKMPMCTVGHWKDGLMIEESLFWDNQTYMNQIGLGK